MQTANIPQTTVRPPPGLRDAYDVFLPLTTRWADNDVFGHLNNVVYYSLFDTALCHHFVRAGILQDPVATHILMMAESGCRFHAQVSFPDRVTAGLRLDRLGGSSIRHEMAVFANEATVAAAEGFMVHVCVDARTRRPARLPDRWRSALQGLKE